MGRKNTSDWGHALVASENKTLNSCSFTPSPCRSRAPICINNLLGLILDLEFCTNSVQRFAPPRIYLILVDSLGEIFFGCILRMIESHKMRLSISIDLSDLLCYETLARLVWSFSRFFLSFLISLGRIVLWWVYESDCSIVLSDPISSWLWSWMRSDLVSTTWIFSFRCVMESSNFFGRY